jgi:hypothetical protein
LMAPVVPDSVELLTAVGVPETVHVIAAPAASEDTGTVGTHTVVKPAGSPPSAQVAFVAAIAGAAAFVHAKVPL